MLKIKHKRRIKKSLISLLIATSVLMGCDKPTHDVSKDTNKKIVDIDENKIPMSDSIEELTEKIPGEVELIGEREYLLQNVELDDFDFSTIKDAKHVKIINCNLKSLEPMYELQDLQVLEAEYSFLENIDGISNFSKLRGVSLDHNCIKNVNFNELSQLNLAIINMVGNPLVEEEVYNYCLDNQIKTNISSEEIEAINEVKNILNTLPISDLSEIEKINYFYKYTVDALEYNKYALDEYELAKEYNSKPLYYSLRGMGVCINYTELMNTLCQLSGINSYKSYFYSKDIIHTANLIYDSEDERYIIVDATSYDNSKKVFINDPYFCVNDNVSVYNHYLNLNKNYNPVFMEGAKSYGY